MRLQGFPGALSLLSSWRMRQKEAGGAFSWQTEHSSLACILHPRNSPLPGKMRQQGPENYPHPQITVTEEEDKPGEGRGASYASSAHAEMSRQGPILNNHQAPTRPWKWLDQGPKRRALLGLYMEHL